MKFFFFTLFQSLTTGTWYHVLNLCDHAVGGPLRFLLLMEGISNWQECFQCQDLPREEVGVCPLFFTHALDLAISVCLTMLFHFGDQGIANLFTWIWLDA